jgi:hypothetical protein
MPFREGATIPLASVEGGRAGLHHSADIKRSSRLNAEAIRCPLYTNLLSHSRLRTMASMRLHYLPFFAIFAAAIAAFFVLKSAKLVKHLVASSK